jgi:hypothetical protein
MRLSNGSIYECLRRILPMADDLTPEQMRCISEAIAYQHGLDYEEAGPKAPHGPIVYKGVVLSSRYDVQSEFTHMRGAIDLIPELLARRIESIWCDSNACAYYVVTVRPRLFVEALVDEVEAAFKELGGFNGLDIECDEGQGKSFDPWWPEDEFFQESELSGEGLSAENSGIDEEIRF